LLRCLKKGHYDISDYFKEDFEINNPREEIELQERFDEATLEDILNNIEGKYNEIRNNFMQDVKMSTNPAKGIFQLIDDLFCYHCEQARRFQRIRKKLLVLAGREEL
jgi:hypothetical protein